MGAQFTTTLSRSEAIDRWKDRIKCKLSNKELEDFLGDDLENFIVLDDKAYYERDEDGCKKGHYSEEDDYEAN